MAARYLLDDDILFLWGIDDIFLRCLTQTESLHATKETHRGLWVNTMDVSICINSFGELAIIGR